MNATKSNLSSEVFVSNENMKKEITTVFPATTTAATYSMMTGLNPIEHGYLGWYSYIDPLDETIVLFRGTNKVTQEISPGYAEARQKYFVNKTITDEINEKGKSKSRILFPFGDDKYNDLDDMLSIIKKECSSDGKKYIYAYDNQPDHTMHELGSDSDQVKELIKTRNKKVEDLCNKLEDTIVFVIADHGHIKVENIFLNDYPEIVNMLERTTSLEQRAVSFKIKDGLHQKFEKLFNCLFTDAYQGLWAGGNLAGTFAGEEFRQGKLGFVYEAWLCNQWEYRSHACGYGWELSGNEGLFLAIQVRKAGIWGLFCRAGVVDKKQFRAINSQNPSELLQNY